MNFQSRISRCPRAFDPDRGQEARALFNQLAPEIRDVVAGAGGSSPYLMSLLVHEQEWIGAALTRDPASVLDDLLQSTASAQPDMLRQALRATKRRVALYCALADLGGVWSLQQVTSALTRFADAAVDVTLGTLVADAIARNKIPGAGPDDVADAAGMVVLAMGKMGAYELNYSSDIDLICLFDETRYAPDDYGDVRTAFVRITRKMAAILSDLTGDGYVFRTDLRLRPDPSVTPVCLSMEAAERYYEGVGRTWERAAHIKARACAGDIAAGQAYLDRLTPFVWRKHLDFAAIQDAHDMRLRIRQHKRLHGPIVLEGHNMKLGAGGIREIEFFTQTRQLIAGGRDPDLRARATLEGLAQLTDKGWVEAPVSAALASHYAAHREIEHRLQMVNDAQTHDLPKSGQGFDRLAAMCDRDTAALRQDLDQRLAEVAALTEGFFAPGQSGADAMTATEIGAETARMLTRWPTYPALRSARAAEIFHRLQPEILLRLQKAANPDQAFAQFDRFLAGLPAGVQVFSLFEANHQLIDLIVDIAATAPQLASYLGRNAQVFDAVIGGDFFADWPTQDDLSAQLAAQLADVADYEAKLDQARRWQKEWHFRIGVHQLRGLIDADIAGAQYAALADAVVAGVWPIVQAEFARKHGLAPGPGAAIVAMGSLGSQRLTAASDLDLIVIYDAGGVEQSDGRRPLASRTYYARLTQAMVTALSAPMAEGRLYEVDMRLRPSGRQGPVATSFDAFCTYQLNEAWTWEHLALTRARPVVWAADLGPRIESFRRGLLARQRDQTAVLADVQDMRTRIATAKPAQGEWEAKLGRGRMQDVELLAQTAALLSGSDVRRIQAQLETGIGLGWLSKSQVAVLQRSYALMWRLQSAARLLTGDVLDLAVVGQGGTDFLLRETVLPDVDALARELDLVSNLAGDIVDTALGSAPQTA